MRNKEQYKYVTVSMLNIEFNIKAFNKEYSKAHMILLVNSIVIVRNNTNFTNALT